MLILRDYQEDAYQRTRLAAKKSKRILLVAPTGSGKTVIASHFIASAVAKHNSVLFSGPRREIIVQTSKKLHAYEVDHGIIMNGFRPRIAPLVQVASWQTLIRRDFPPAKILFIDEAHGARSASYKKIIEHYDDAFIIGLTATPCRADGKGLGNIFDEMVEVSDMQSLIDDGYLVPNKVYAPSEPDLKGVKTVRGDYEKEELQKRSDQPKLVGDIVDHWIELAKGRSTVAFASGVAHSLHIVDAFRAAGISAEHIDGDTEKHHREEILNRLIRGETKVVSNVGVLTEGWDAPEVSCLILARPTKSFGLYMQMAGRVLRPHDGKDHALILDHAGNTLRHGFIHEPIEWSLDTDESIDKKRKAEREKRERTEWVCDHCYAVNEPHRQLCGNCGLRPVRQAVNVAVGDGKLKELKHAPRPKISKEEKQALINKLVAEAQANGYQRGWVAHRYKAVTGVWPRGLKFDYQKEAWR